MNESPSNTSGNAGDWLPVFMRMRGAPALVVGGAVEARRKVDRLLKHGARIDLWFDADAAEDPALRDYLHEGRVQRIDAPNRRDYRLIVVAERGTQLAARAHRFGRRHSIPVNAVDDPERCSAILPAIVDRAPLTIAIGSAGTERALADDDFCTRDSVALVGAGPGDPELLTVKALRLIQNADAIVHDALIDPRVLDFARRDAELFAMGKRGGRCSTPQLDIHTLLLELARAGKRVVRLKGGDPMVFGRGGEELEFLRAHQIPYSVVPGITAAAGCAATAGIPLTHRDHAQSVHLITAHGKQSIDRLDWRSLARERQTLAFYMAVSRLRTVQANLLRHGRNPATPVAIVENGARPEQRVMTGVLGQLDQLAERFGAQSPAILYIGEVAQLAESLAWYGDQQTLQLDPAADLVAVA